jgi:N-hydroxyarylamine O-acetyltransferase
MTTANLADYCRRITYHGELTPTAEVLRSIHLAHATHVPFENIDPLSGVPVNLDIASLEDKLVARRRGGYCFEQNMLLAAMLEAVGFKLKRLLARVRFRSQHVLPLTHMALDVEADGRHWLCDVGFGGHGLLEPLPLEPDEFRQGDWTYRLTRTDNRWWMLQAPLEDGWIDLYTFTRDGYELVDFEPPNFYVSQYPDSIFVKHLIAQRPLPEVRHILVGRDYSEIRASGITTRQIESTDDLLATLDEKFDLQVAPGPWIDRFAGGVD